MKKCKNGHSINKVVAENGNPSILYKNLVTIYNGDAERAYHNYLKIHTQEFKDWFGNWEKISESKKYGSRIKGMYSSLFLEDPEQVLYEAAIQSKSDSPKRAVEIFGEDIVRIAKEMFPNVKVGDEFNRTVSKAIDENGEPIVVFHGTSTKNTMDNFAIPRKHYSFTTDYETAREKSIKFFLNNNPENAVIYPLFLNIRTEQEGTVDGIEYTVNSQRNIKSIDNKGEFSSSSNNIFEMPSMNSNLQNFNKYKKFINERRVRVGRIINTINSERAKSDRDESKISRLQNRIEEIKTELVEYERKITLDTIYKAGVKDINEVADAVKRGNMSIDELESAQHVANLWAGANELLFTAEELERDETGNQSENVRMFRALIAEAVTLKTDLDAVHLNLVTKQVSSELNISLEEARKRVSNDFTDINSVTSLFRDLSSFNNLPLAAMDLMTRRAANATNREFVEITKKINEVFKKVDKKDYNLMLQEDSRGVITGNFITRYSWEYQETRRKLKKEFENTGNAKNFVDWLRANTMYFDVNKLFYIDADGEVKDKEDKAHKAELVYHLGEELYQDYLIKQRRRIERYASTFERIKTDINERDDISDVDKKILIDEWEIANSPFTWTFHLSSDEGHRYNDSKGKRIKLSGYMYTQSFPKKFNANGERTDWWDEKYERMESNANLLELYKLSKTITKDLLNYLPDNITKELDYNIIPVLEKTLLEIYRGSGGATALVGLKDNLIKSITSGEDKETVFGDVNPITGKIEPKLKVGMLNHNKLIEEIYKFKLENFMLDNNLAEDEVQEEDAKRLLQEARDEFNLGRSYDFPKLLTAFASMALNFKHKSRVEGGIRLIQSFVHNSLERYETQQGEVKKDKFGEKILAVGALSNLKKAVDNYVDVFFNDKAPDKSLRKKKLYTAKEKELKEKLENKIVELEKQKEIGELEQAEFDFQKKLAQDKINKLGENVSMQNVGKMILKYNQLKGMGWNVFAGITNLVYGWISNATHAAGEEDFGFADLRKAKYYSLILSKEPKTRNKIFRLMKKFDVLKESSEASTKEKLADSKKYVGFSNLKPYEMQKSSDYTVQSELFLAIMFNTKVKDLNGVERSVYEAYDEKGEWKIEEFGENNDWEGDPNDVNNNSESFKLKIKVDQLIKKLHANVDPLSPILIKRSVFGKLLMQFRSWVPEGFANRFEKEKSDFLLGRVKKGRYVSFYDLKGKEGEEIESPIFTAVSITVKNMLNLVSFGVLAKDAGRRLSAVDKANLRKNAYELNTYIALFILVSMLKAELDDEDEETVASLNYFINQGYRIQQDILFYTSPVAFENLADNAIPIFGLVTDFYKWAGSIVDLLQGEDEYERGIYAGQSKFARKTAKIFPFTTQIIRNTNAMERVINK